MQKQKIFYVVRALDTYTLHYVDITFKTKLDATEYYNSFKKETNKHTMFSIMLIKFTLKTNIDFEIAHTFIFTNNLLDYTETIYDRANSLLRSKLVKGNYYEIAKQYDFDFVIQKKRFV